MDPCSSCQTILSVLATLCLCWAQKASLQAATPGRWRLGTRGTGCWEWSRSLSTGKAASLAVPAAAFGWSHTMRVSTWPWRGPALHCPWQGSWAEWGCSWTMTLEKWTSLTLSAWRPSTPSPTSSLRSCTPSFAPEPTSIRITPTRLRSAPPKWPCGTVWRGDRGDLTGDHRCHPANCELN